MRFNRADEIKIKELAEKYDLPVETIKNIVSSPYSFISKKCKEIEFPDGLSREEFDKMKTNFNVPSLFKLHASYYMYNKIQENKSKKTSDL